MNENFNRARKVCDAAFEIAQTMNVNVSIVAVDPGGHPVVVLRGDRTSFASVEAARRKAVAAFTMQMPTGALAEMIAQDPLVQRAVHASGDMLVVPGGFPIGSGDGCIGGLGIAGGHYSQDHTVGEKALAAVAK